MIDGSKVADGSGYPMCAPSLQARAPLQVSEREQMGGLSTARPHGNEEWRFPAPSSFTVQPAKLVEKINWTLRTARGADTESGRTDG